MGAAERADAIKGYTEAFGAETRGCDPAPAGGGGESAIAGPGAAPVSPSSDGAEPAALAEECDSGIGESSSDIVDSTQIEFDSWGAVLGPNGVAVQPCNRVGLSRQRTSMAAFCSAANLLLSLRLE